MKKRDQKEFNKKFGKKKRTVGGVEVVKENKNLG